ncbi:MAG: LCP family protein [Clostridia bacterium]|nr:LCP family protein [Clostridia bacterium]
MKNNTSIQKKEKRFETLIIIAFTLFALVVGIAIVAGNFSPADPAVDTDVPFHTGDKETQTDEDGNKVDVEAGTVDKYIRREGVYNFLFVGYDKAAGLTDVNMLAQFDTNTGAINIIQLPRDTYARYNSRAGSYRKINGALGYYGRDLSDFASFLEKNLCINIDYYGSVNLVAFRNIVDIIGGVEMYVPRDMYYDDPEQDLYIDLKEGYQTLNGEQAEQFVRFRKGYVNADIGRMDAQKIFMTAFMEKFIDSMSVSTLTQVGTQMLKHVDTNLTLNEYVFFATKVLSIDTSKLTMMTLPGKDVRENGTSGSWYYVLSRSAMLEAVNKYLNVYTKEITDSIFDPDMVFTNPDSDYMVKIYRSDVTSDIHVGSDVTQSGIYIPPTKTGSTQTKPTETDAPSGTYEPTDTDKIPDNENPDVDEQIPLDTDKGDI